jgi:hypothetical protein
VVLAEVSGSIDDTALRRRVKQSILAAMGLALADVFLVPRGWLVKTTSGKISRTENLAKLEAAKQGDFDD